MQPASMRSNPSLFWGMIITLAVILLAWVGPLFALQDPMATNYVAHVGDKWIRPPFPAFTVPGYPLGSDTFGRDVLSRLLWGVRPTLLLVSAVAVVRLILGLLIGVASGWSTGAVGRTLKGLTSGALAVPVLLVGLAINAALAPRLGMWAFVLGLVFTGWAETARLVREQTLLIRTQPYVEAARALGASGLQIVTRHVLTQIFPLIWMFWAFEISGTMLITAELGFLGYYIGGGTWVQVSDFTAVNVTGAPELGQMLATSYNNMLFQPEGMVAAGTVIFLAILGFNLLGEGLRRQLSLDHLRHESPAGKVLARVEQWFDRRLGSAAYTWLRQRAPLVAGAALALAVMIASLLWWKSEAAPRNALRPALATSSDLGWAMERHDAQGSLWTEAAGPTDTSVAWTFAAEAGGFSGGPVVAGDGTVYIGAKSGKLYALNPDGTLRWTIDVGQPLIGSPAVGPYGDIYVTDAAARLSVYQPDQLLLWRFESKDATAATSGPVVAPNGTAYYALGNILQAVSLDGRALWQGKIRQYLYIAPRLSADGSLIFLYNIAFRTADGSSFALQLGSANPSEVVNPMHVVGGDGQTYYYFGHSLIPWQVTEKGVTAGSTVTWNYSGQELQLPVDAGATGEGMAWLYYSNGYAPPRIVWISVADGHVLGNLRYMQSPSRLLAMGPGGVAYVCGASGQKTSCAAYQPDVAAPIWEAALGSNGPVSGGALVPGRLYVTTDSGMLFAIGQGASPAQPAPAAARTAARTAAPTWTLPFPAQTLTPEP
jgi:peptide/nickel transport system permease protein